MEKKTKWTKKIKWKNKKKKKIQRIKVDKKEEQIGKKKKQKK